MSTFLRRSSNQPTRTYQPSDDQTIPMGVLVNGQVAPNVKMSSKKWYRFRMLYAALEMDLEACQVERLPFGVWWSHGAELKARACREPICSGHGRGRYNKHGHL